jgi:hypothetical protein
MDFEKDMREVKKRFYDKKYNDYVERKQLRKKYDSGSYFRNNSNPNSQLRTTIKSKINHFIKADKQFDDFYTPCIETKKCMTFWDCRNQRRHKIV